MMTTFDSVSIDGTNAFLVSELERLDPTLHQPLASVTWSRDIDLREDVSIADEIASFTNSSFAAAGGTRASGKAWIAPSSTAVPAVGVDTARTGQPLMLWGQSARWSVIELETSQRLGRPLDAQQVAAITLKWNMDVDEQVYVGDDALGVTGLLNNAGVARATVAAGSQGATGWSSKTADEILTDIDGVLNAAWQASAWAVCPDRLLLPPASFSQLVARKLSDQGDVSILEFLRRNSLSHSINGRPLDIAPVKWLAGLGEGDTNRLVAYSKDAGRVRFPLVPLRRTPVEYRGLYQELTYYGRLGVVEFVYPETAAYRDGI